MSITIEPTVGGVSIEAGEVGFPTQRTATGGFVIQTGTLHFGQNRSSLVRITLPPGSTGPLSSFISAKISYEIPGPGRQRAEVTARERIGDMSTTIKVPCIFYVHRSRNDVTVQQMNRYRQLFASTVLNSISMMKTSDMDRAQTTVKELIRQIQ